jgi:hypothetical protein
MYVNGSQNNKTFQGVTTRSAETVTTQDNESASDFGSILSGILSPLGKESISEEELFAGVIQARIKATKGDEAASEYASALAAEKSANSGNRRFSVEEAARGVLSQLQEDGTLTEAEATTIHAESFKAAQLDDNKEALYDDKGGPTDPTIAIAKLEAALLSARTVMEEIESGDANPGQLGLDIGNTGLPSIRVKIMDDGTFGLPNSEDSSKAVNKIGESEPLDGPEGFLFKPVSDTTGNLVILLPHALKEQVESVILKNSAGEVLDQGNDGGYGNGDRQHFRFSKPGSEYPEQLTVEVKLEGGQKKVYLIEDPSLRYD